YTYDSQNRQISAWFNQPLMEGAPDFGFREETVYSDDGRKSETTTYREGKEPEKSVTYYNDRGHVVRAVLTGGMKVHYTYAYRTDQLDSLISESLSFMERQRRGDEVQVEALLKRMDPLIRSGAEVGERQLLLLFVRDGGGWAAVTNP